MFLHYSGLRPMANKQVELEQRRQELASLEEDLRGLPEGAVPPIRDLADDRLAEGKQASAQELKMKIEHLKAQVGDQASA